MKGRYQYFIIIVMAVCFTACKKTNTQGRLIPDDAAIALQVDGKSLLSKLSWNEIKENQLFQAMYSDSSLKATIKKLLDDPEKAGIDIHNDLLFFTKKDSSGGYVAIEGSVKDAALLKTFNAGITNNGSENESDGVHYISHGSVKYLWFSCKSCVSFRHHKWSPRHTFNTAGYIHFPITAHNCSCRIHYCLQAGGTQTIHCASTNAYG